MTRTRTRLAAAGVALVGLAAGVTGVVGILPGAHATPVVGVYRFAGANRYGTAQLIGDYKAQGSSTFAFGTPTNAVLASGDNFPDALSSNFLAGGYGSPIFLTSAGSLSPEALAGIQGLGVKKVTIVGGSSAVSPAEDVTLTSDGITVTRVAGPDRDGTAAAVAASAPISGYNGQGLTAILANDSADHYVDALSAGPMAWEGHLPILLTPGASLSAETSAALSTLKIKHVIIVGGTDAVSSGVQATVEGLGVTVERLAGADRQETAIAIANAEKANLGFSSNVLGLAVGDNFPDALAGGPLSGLEKAPILLTTDPNTLNADTQAYLASNNFFINELYIFGGTAAISDAVVAQAVGSSTCASGTPGTTTSTVATTSSTTAGVTTTTAGATTTTAGVTTTTAAATTTSTGPTTTLGPCTATTTTVAPTTTTTLATTTTA